MQRAKLSLVALVSVSILTVVGCGPQAAGGLGQDVDATASAASLASGTGLKAEYFNQPNLTGLVTTRVDPTVNFNWNGGAPALNVPRQNFSVRWSGQVEARASQPYTFYVTSDDGVRLWVNDQLVVDNWTDHAPSENSGTLTLAAGQRYNIKMEYYQRGGQDVAKLAWSSPSQTKEIVPQSQLYPTAAAGGLTAEYFSDPNLTTLALARTDAQVDFDWSSTGPLPQGANTNFSVRWTGQVQPRFTERYTFTTSSDDGIRLWVNGQVVIDNWTDHAPTDNSGTIDLVAGQKYDLKLEYYQRAGQAIAKLAWSSPSEPAQLVPSSLLSPRVTTPIPPGGGTGSGTGTGTGSGTGTGTGTGSGTPPGGTGSGTGNPSGWLYTSGNHLYTSDGKVWHGRGANLHDTRSCNACAYEAPNVNEVIRRADELVDNWHANFIRLDLESYASSGGRVQWQTILNDPSYLADIQTIVRHIESKPGVYVLLSLWIDPSFDANGWPTQATSDEWRALANAFKNDPQVMFGLVNEPQNNYDGSQDSQVWTAMNNTVAAIRSVEASNGTPNHVIAVQGTGGWARYLKYYVSHPITAGSGKNIAYETHIYNPTSDFDTLLNGPAMSLPVIIGEFGPYSGVMNETDCTNLLDRAQALEVPHIAWSFHMRCDPNLLVDNSGGGCGVGMSLQPTGWGSILKSRYAQPW